MGVRSAIEETQKNIDIIAECATGKEFYALLGQNIVPHLVLLDIYLPDTTGIEIAGFLKKHYPQVKIIVLSSEVTEETVNKLLAIDVEGYLSKMALMSDLEKAIHSVLSGNHYYGQSVARILQNVYLAKDHDRKVKRGLAGNKDDLLTDREKEVIRFICDGYTAKKASEELNMSVRTFETHKSNTLKKLGFRNIAEVIKYAVKNKIVVWE